jgi:hypothetical protein
VKRLSRTTPIVVSTLCLSLWAASGNAQQHQQGLQQPHLQQNSAQQKTEPAQPTSKEQAPPTQQPATSTPAAPVQQQSPVPPEKPEGAGSGPSKEELDRLQQQAARAAESAKLPDPARSFEPGAGLDIRVDFLHGGYSNRKLEVGLFGINMQLCRIKRVSFCGIGTVLMITSGADESNGNKDIRFVLTSPLSFNADEDRAWTVYPFWDPVNNNRFGMAGGISFNWMQLLGKLRPGKPKDIQPPTQ